MHKTLTAGAIVMIAVLLVGSCLFPASPIMWLASTSIVDTGIRIALVLMLVGLYFTDPPRHLVFRYVLGCAAALLGLFTLTSFYNNQIQLLDMLVYLEASVLFALAALESDPLTSDLPNLSATP